MEYLGFEKQPSTEGSCGAYSLGHALNLVGIPCSIRQVKKDCKYTSNLESLGKYLRDIFSTLDGGLPPGGPFVHVGTEDVGIKGGLNKYGCSTVYLSTKSENKAKGFIDNNLQKGFPVIMCVNTCREVDDTGHWFVCGGNYKSKYVIIDSYPDSNVVTLYDWTKLKRRFYWIEEDEDGEEESFYQFDLIAVKSKTSTCVGQMDKVFDRLNRNKYLQQWWGIYLSDLVSIADSGKINNPRMILLSKLLMDNYNHLVETIPYWLADISKSDLAYELKNYILVAEAYNFYVPEKKAQKILVSFTSAIIGELIYLLKYY